MKPFPFLLLLGACAEFPNYPTYKQAPKEYKIITRHGDEVDIQTVRIEKLERFQVVYPKKRIGEDEDE
jgi:hypothetical protein